MQYKHIGQRNLLEEAGIVFQVENLKKRRFSLTNSKLEHPETQ